MRTLVLQASVIKRVRRGVARDFRKKIECCSDGSAMKIRSAFCMARVSSPEKASSTAPRALSFPMTSARSTLRCTFRWCILQRKCEGAADETGAEDGDAGDEVTGRHGSGDTAADGRCDDAELGHELSEGGRFEDCAPSEERVIGSLCTSMRRPSAPAATAARAMGGTLSRRPVPCEGSASIGRCESFLDDGDGGNIEGVARVGFEGTDAALRRE